MAKFEVDNSIADMIKKIETFANNEVVYQEMISEGQGIMKSAIEAGARNHIRTGAMASSLRNTKPKQDEKGWVGRVKFTGSDGVVKSKNGQKFDRTNWIKAFRIEYGTSKQKAEPFVRPAIQGCQGRIRNKWNEIFDKELKKLQ